MKKFDSIKSRINTGLRASKQVSQESSVRNPILETPSSQMSEAKEKLLTKFCTFCGVKFVDENHRFCGDCGQPRALLD